MGLIQLHDGYALLFAIWPKQPLRSSIHPPRGRSSALAAVQGVQVSVWIEPANYVELYTGLDQLACV